MRSARPCSTSADSSTTSPPTPGTRRSTRATRAPTQGYMDLSEIPLPEDVQVFTCGPLPFMRHVRSSLTPAASRPRASATRCSDPTCGPRRFPDEPAHPEGRYSWAGLDSARRWPARACSPRRSLKGASMDSDLEAGRGRGRGRDDEVWAGLRRIRGGGRPRWWPPGCWCSGCWPPPYAWMLRPTPAWSASAGRPGGRTGWSSTWARARPGATCAPVRWSTPSPVTR